MEQKIKEAEQWYDKNKTLYERFSEEIEGIIIKVLKAQKIPYQSVSHRVKEKESYLNKCRNEKYNNPIEEIMDISGIRIIAYTNQDVSDICNILQDEFLIDKGNSGNKADMLATDKVGYLSVHYVLQLSKKRLELAEYKEYENLKCEVQVRTLLQHAWAEIEHDRNYKFTGVLPNGIKRRFYLVAGALELMDYEFDKLSKDIDEYAKKTEKALSKGDFNLSINSKSLEQYMLKRFEGATNIKPLTNGVIISEEVVEEVIRFGYKIIQDIENDLREHENVFKEQKVTYIGVLRDLMIIKDCDRYFKVAYNGNWQGTYKSSVSFWKKNGVKDIENYLADYGISINN
ncbi:MAG: hypothetical protein OSJ60_05830 [Lachnospiraceae bacterium]|nr:hypothetical protein [Lachnospiraceae bacterium]